MLLKSCEQDVDRQYLYTIWDWQHIRLENDNLSKFRTAWLKLSRNTEEKLTPHQKKLRFFECVKNSVKLKYYCDRYREVEPRDPDYERYHSFDYLWDSMERVIRREKEASSRLAKEKDLDPKAQQSAHNYVVADGKVHPVRMSKAERRQAAADKAAVAATAEVAKGARFFPRSRSPKHPQIPTQSVNKC